VVVPYLESRGEKKAFAAAAWQKLIKLLLRRTANASKVLQNAELLLLLKGT
jgi:hypothetical protein